MDKRATLEKLKKIDREMVLLEHIGALLNWDQETNMPAAAAAGRAEQISLIQGMLHDRITDPEIEKVLEASGADDSSPGGDSSFSDQERGLVRQYFRQYSRQKKLPRQLVQDLASVTSLAQQSWVKARQEADFSLFQPSLERIIGLTCEMSELLGYAGHPYDPLLDHYEPDMTTREVAEVFSALKKDVVSLVTRISEAQAPDDGFLYLKYKNRLLDQFGRNVLEAMGFDFNRGIMTESAHPFTTMTGSDDVRITTRYNEPAMSSSLFSTIHEGGHALYEMGASSGELKGTALGTGTSLAVHESQSRFWENIVGRSDEFWQHFYPSLQQLFPQQLASVKRTRFVRGINRVNPSMIRVNADEVTYSLHIILRFEIETDLVSGKLRAADLPEVWNAKMEQMLGIVPADDAEGVLQDVHWAAGLIGYFPTYALGNLFSAQFLNTMRNEIPEFDRIIADGRLRELTSWLHEKIYAKGAVYSAGELLEQVTGRPLNPGFYSRYLEEKYGALYNL